MDEDLSFEEFDDLPEVKKFMSCGGFRGDKIHVWERPHVGFLYERFAPRGVAFFIPFDNRRRGRSGDSKNVVTKIQEKYRIPERDSEEKRERDKERMILLQRKQRMRNSRVDSKVLLRLVDKYYEGTLNTSSAKKKEKTRTKKTASRKRKS